MSEIVIPEGSVEIQTGLWAHLKTLIWNGEDRSHYNIYSGEGYCFYNLEQPENSVYVCPYRGGILNRKRRGRN